MKKTILSFVVMMVSLTTFAQVKISTGGGNPNASSMLEVESTTKGFLPPRMTEAQRDVIASPADGLIIFNTTSNCINIRKSGAWYELCGTLPVGTIASINCAGATNNGTLAATVAASGVNSVVAYTGGNSGTHNGQTVTSTGVTGLTATLTAGTFSNGSGTLTYTITGTPSATGTASFALNIGGQSCTLTRTVAAPPCGSFTITDTRDNNVYPTVQIGTQCWMAKNLAYLPVVHSNSQFETQGINSQAGYGVYNYNGSDVAIAKSQANYSTYGVLYNWWAAMAGASSSSANPSGVQGICPTGWHIPSDAEWTQLTDHLGGASVAGGKMKQTGTSLWQSPNTSADNSSGFTGLPGGIRYDSGFDYIGSNGYWWNSTQNRTDIAYYRGLLYTNGNVSGGDDGKTYGFSVRCLRD